MMVGASILLVGLLGQVTGGAADYSELVARLGAGRFVDREAASRSLEELGGAALPALRAARAARDPEVRNRAAGLVQKIEGALLTQPTRMRLDFDRTPLPEVVRSLSRQAGFKVVLSPDALPRWKYSRVTLHEPGLVPFWKAMDRLCDAAVLQPNPQMQSIAGPREPTFALTDGTSRVPTPNYDHGPFRVSLQGIHYQRDVTFGPPTPVRVGGFGLADGDPHAARPARPVREARPAPGRFNPVTTDLFTANFLVAAEPRLCISQTGALQITEAVDERGNSLIAQPGGGPFRPTGYFPMTSGPLMQIQAHLHHPDEPGRIIRRLRGVIPVAVSSRGPEPLVVPLDQGVGKRISNEDFEVILHGIRKAPNAPQMFVELTVKTNDRPGTADNGEMDTFGDVYRSDAHRQQLEILDVRGRLLTWFPSGVDSETSRLTLTIMNPPASGSLKELRYYTLTRTTIDLPFEFADLPMP